MDGVNDGVNDDRGTPAGPLGVAALAGLSLAPGAAAPGPPLTVPSAIPAPAVPDGLLRITVARPGRRTDLAVPAGIPVAHLLADIVRLTGAPAPGGAAGPGGAGAQAADAVVLRRLDGGLVDPELALEAQGVADGTLLCLGPAGPAAPGPVHDDIAEHAADLGPRLGGCRWGDGDARTACLAAAGLMIGLSPVAAVAAGVAGVPAGAASAVLALVLLAVTSAKARAAGPASPAVTTAGLAALPAAFTAGYALAGPLSVLAGSCALLVATAVLAALPARAPFRAAAVLAVAAALSSFAHAVAGGRPYEIAAVVAVAAVGAVTFTPAWAARGVGGARPAGPGAEARVLRAHRTLCGLAGGCAASGGAATVLLASTGRAWPGVLAVVAGFALACRARLFPAVAQVVPLLAAGAAGPVAVLATAVVRSAAGGEPAAWPAVAAVTAGASALLAATAAPGGLSPLAGRCLDLADAAARAALVPLALLVLDVHSVVRAAVA